MHLNLIIVKLQEDVLTTNDDHQQCLQYRQLPTQNVHYTCCCMLVTWLIFCVKIPQTKNERSVNVVMTGTGKVRPIFCYELKPPQFSEFFVVYIVANNGMIH